MKKFLSVLLALAVAFTFTFGSTMSAFAEDTDPVIPNVDQVKLLDEALTYAQTQVDNSYAKAYEAAVKSVVIENVTITQESWDAVGVKALVDKYLNDTYLEQGADYTIPGSATTYKAVAEAMYNGLVGAAVDTESELKDFILENYSAKAALNQYKADLAELDKAVANVDYDQYSTNVNATTGKTYLEEAKDAVAAIKANCKAALRTTGDCYVTEANIIDTYVSKSAAYEALIIGEDDGLLSEIMIGNTAVGTGKYTVNGVTTKTMEANQGITDSATAAAVKAKAQENYANQITTDPTSKSAADAYLTVVTYLADAYAIGTCPNYNGGLESVVATITDLNAYAAKYKAETDANGNVVRDAKAVDNIVKATTIYLYKAALRIEPNAEPDYTTAAAAKEAIAALTSEAAAKQFAFEQEKRIAAIKAEQEAVVKAERYYPLELEKYNAAVEDAIAKVKAAKITDNLELITVDTADILIAADVDRTFAVAPLSTEFGKQVTAISNTINNVKNYGKTVLDPTYIVCNDVADALLAYCGEKGIRTVDEVKALSAEEFIATLPTRGQIKDAKNAAETAIKAIPSIVKYADKATVEVAYDAAQAYAEIMGEDNYTDLSDLTNADKLSGAINDLYDEMVKDFAVKAYQVSKTDKAALKALKAEFDAANVDKTENNKIGSGMFAGKDAFNDSVVTDALDQIKTNEEKAVKAAIAAIPINLTVADKSKVEAARKLYDAFIAEYTDAENDVYPATGLVTELKALKDAEAAIAALEEAAPKYTDTNAKADLLDMSRKLTIWRTSKTSIKVTAVGSVKNIKDNGYTVKYSFYKKAPGATSYKLIKTTSSNKYTYTNLKKGTNKFQVKVVVKDADGKVVASKWTYYRAAKIK